MDEVERIVAGLTKAGRRMILTDDRLFADHVKGKWFAMNIKTARRLHELGLIEEDSNLARPTPLGLALRAHLLKGNGDATA